MTVIRRVPVDFAWPLNQRWEGYLLPDQLRGRDCTDCDGGQTYAGWWLQRFCQRLTMLADDVSEQERGRPLHPWLANDPYPATKGLTREVVRPSEDIRTLIDGLMGEDGPHFLGYMGKDYRLFEAIVKAAGLETWGGCTTCDGEGTMEVYPGQAAKRDAWEPTDPPTGDGWQAWEDVSEGSPISPVFPDREGLVVWFTTPASVWGARERPLTREQAEALVAAGASVGSGAIIGGVLYDGDSAVLAVQERKR